MESLYFSLDENIDNNIIDIPRQIPAFCRKNGTKTKPTCFSCEALCSYSMERILHHTNPITQSDLLEELEIHHHPKSRIIECNGIKRSRLSLESARELADHYIYAHNKKEPFFL